MPIGTSIKEAVYWLKRGEPVALPTETVYGLAAPLSSVKAIRKVYSIKSRPFTNPLIVHVQDVEELETVAQKGDKVRDLCAHFWPGPLTLLLPKKTRVPDLVTAGLPTVAVRAPAQTLFRRVLKALGEPLVAPSANRFMGLSPTRARHVQDDLGDRVPYILDGGPCRFGIESTILSLINEDRPQLLRPGPVSVEELEAVLKCSIAAPPLEDEEKHPKPCPGLFRKHYSPRTPLILYPSLQNSPPPETNIARVFFQKPIHTTGEAVFWLTSKGDLNQAASRLFRLLQELDRKGYDEIWMETAPDTGIGRAINDRLRHAAAQNTDAS